MSTIEFEKNQEKNELIQTLQDYIDFLVKNSNGSLGFIYPHFRGSDEVILEGRRFRNKLRSFEELKDWEYLIKNYKNDLKTEVK